MDLMAVPWVQGSLVTIVLAMIFTMAGAVFKGYLIPQKRHEEQLADLRADRDARVAEANADAEEWRRLWTLEHEAHDLTRRAYAEEIRAVLLASTEGTQIGVALLKELKAKSEAP
ncbi:hypothetical protein [Microbispora sp. ATCC PTA-5024]|uniref:hypothetical protein n=1 Tax=Microbispora sp. ATCC PTA-5024 TaxID=316330 RepID=UPI0003DB8D85|nr:hypothetical protein [Microbispora sp. ATCC PTA-5024]ETK36112.1 hypothetical protein MPTA5024_10835 [Microbispora sp. ATCC PTA-5024]